MESRTRRSGSALTSRSRRDRREAQVWRGLNCRQHRPPLRPPSPPTSFLYSPTIFSASLLTPYTTPFLSHTHNRHHGPALRNLAGYVPRLTASVYNCLPTNDDSSIQAMSTPGTSDSPPIGNICVSAFPGIKLRS